MKPILFNTEMVRAILDGRKAVTRRAVKLPTNRMTGKIPNYDDVTGGQLQEQTFHFYENPFYSFSVKPPYRPCDILYVRETWANYSYDNTESNAAYYLYRADYEPNAKGYWYEPEHIHFCDFPRWRPSIHMPKEAARLFLRVTDVRVDRLQAMSHEDAKQEGCGCDEGGLAMPLDKFADLWDSTIKKADLTRYGWDANPWVWVTEFERISRGEALKDGEGNG